MGKKKKETTSTTPDNYEREIEGRLSRLETKVSIILAVGGMIILAAIQRLFSFFTNLPK